jgi:hypothetical protein
MVRVALLQPTVNTPSGANDVMQQAPQLPTANAQLAQQFAGAAQAVGGAIDKYQFLQERQKTQDAAAWSANAASNATLTWQQKMQELQQNSASGAPDFTKNFLSDFDQYKTEQLAAAPNDESRRFLNQHLDTIRTQLGGQAIAFQGQQHIKWREEQITQATDSATQIAFNDPAQRDQALQTVLAPLDAMDMPGAWKDEMKRKATQAVNLAAATSVAQTNPAAIVGQPGSAATAAGGGQNPGGFAGADAFVAQKEGGLLPSDTNKTPTNFGINQAANPDVDVKNLTPEQAAQIRKTRYWDAIHGDALSPAMQPVAYNFAIQAGAGAANNLLQQANGDPAKFNDLAKQYYANIPPEKQQGYLPAWQKRSDEAYQLGQSAPASADNPLLSNLPYQSRVQVFNQAKTQQSQDMAMWRGRIEAGLADRQAAAANGISDPTPLTLPVLLKAFPPEEAAQRYTQYLDGQQLARDVSTLKGMPSDQITGLVQAREPVAGPGYAQAQHDQQILTSAAAHVMEQRNADPSAYVAQNATSVKAAQQAFAANPTPQTAQLYAQTSMAEQQRIGIPKPQILTKMQAQTIEDQIKENNGANADQVIQQQAALWGPQWGNVFGQLKNIPPVAKVIGYLGNSIDTSTRQQIMQASQVKIEDLKDGLLPANITAASQALQAKTAPFAGTMAYTTGGAQTFSALYDAADRLSLTYMRQGASPADAASRAFDAVIGKQFNVSGAARIPTQFDKDAVMTGAQGVMNNLPSMDLVMPPAPAAMNASDVRDQYVSNLKSNGKWVTSADGKGLVLFDPISQTVVRTKDGQTVGASFTDLTAKKTGATPNSAPAAFSGSTPNPFSSANSDTSTTRLGIM